MTNFFPVVLFFKTKDMKDNDFVYFYPSESFFKKAAAHFKQEKGKLCKVFPDADIQHVGSSSIPGAWGKFDIDIQIRVHEGQFVDTRDLLALMYYEKHTQLWKQGLGMFEDYSGEINCMVTIIDSIYDDFYKLRDYFMCHPAELQAYNKLKKEYHGRRYRLYRAAKQEFLGTNGFTKFLTNKTPLS